MSKSEWNPLNYSPSELLKSVAGFFAPGLVSLGSAITADSDGGSKITTTEWLTALIAAVVTSTAVFAAKNKKVDPPPNPDNGYVGIGLVFTVVGVVLILLGLLGLFHVLGLSLALSVTFAVVGVVLLVVGGRTA